MNLSTVEGTSPDEMSDVGARVTNKVCRRLLPFLVLLFFVNTMDRINVAFGAFGLNAELGFNAEVYGFGAGIFFIGYFLFEVPSNLLLHRFGARIWIFRIMLTWGLVASGMALVQGATSFYVLRFLLGVAEAGFLPGIVLYLSHWIPQRRLVWANSLFFVGAPLTTVLAGPLCGLLLGFDGLGGMAGWRWMFLLTGMPAVLLSFAVLAYLDNEPEAARWLEPLERDWLTQQLRAEREAASLSSRHSLWDGLANKRVIALSALYFCLVVGVYGVGFWLPQIVKKLGTSTLQASLITAIPYAVASIASIGWCRIATRFTDRRWAVALPMMVAAASFAVSAVSHMPVLSIAALTVAATCMYATLPVFWAIPSGFLVGAAAATGIALVNSIGNLGGFAGAYVVGWINQRTGGFEVALGALGASMLLAAVQALLLPRGDSRRSAIEEGR